MNNKWPQMVQNLRYLPEILQKLVTFSIGEKREKFNYDVQSSECCGMNDRQMKEYGIRKVRCLNEIK